MDKPKTFWMTYCGDTPVDGKAWDRKEDALKSALQYAQEDQLPVRVFQCTPVASFNPVIEEKSWD